jgi:DNA gyrase/topoisomerase IV subunit A
LTRIPAGEFREIGRNTQGVRAFRLAEGDRLVCAARVLPATTNGNGDSESPDSSDMSEQSDASDKE